MNSLNLGTSEFSERYVGYILNSITARKEIICQLVGCWSRTATLILQLTVDVGSVAPARKKNLCSLREK